MKQSQHLFKWETHALLRNLFLFYLYLKDIIFIVHSCHHEQRFTVLNYRPFYISQEEEFRKYIVNITTEAIFQIDN